jgi:hypothetical protein
MVCARHGVLHYPTNSLRRGWDSNPRSRLSETTVFETGAVRPLGYLSWVHPAGIEPASKDPQSLILSIELRVRMRSEFNGQALLIH